MTVRINLLPSTYQPPKQLGLREWALVAGAAAVLVATAVFYMDQVATTAHTETDLKVTQVRLKQVKTELATAADVTAREAKVKAAEAQLLTLAGRPWSTVLLSLRDLTPQHVTWTSLKTEADTMTLRGTTKGLGDLAQLMGGLTDNPAVASVVLHYVDEKGGAVAVTAGKDKAAQVPTADVNRLRQLEFELVITLERAEGGQVPHGA